VSEGESLFSEGLDHNALITIAYYHGFVTHTTDEQGRPCLTSPNQLTKPIFLQTLFANLHSPRKSVEQLRAAIRQTQLDRTEIRRIVVAGIEGADKAAVLALKLTREKWDKQY
jgi:hypothetical protein